MLDSDAGVAPSVVSAPEEVVEEEEEEEEEAEEEEHEVFDDSFDNALIIYLFIQFHYFFITYIAQ